MSSLNEESASNASNLQIEKTTLVNKKFFDLWFVSGPELFVHLSTDHVSGDQNYQLHIQTMAT
jgi:hypothetical protein